MKTLRHQYRCRQVATRNDTLFKASACLGNFIAGGDCCEREAIEALWAACQEYRTSDGDEQARATIHSGIETGKQGGRKAPERTNDGLVDSKKLVNGFTPHIFKLSDPKRTFSISLSQSSLNESRSQRGRAVLGGFYKSEIPGDVTETAFGAAGSSCVLIAQA